MHIAAPLLEYRRISSSSLSPYLQIPSLLILAPLDTENIYLEELRDPIIVHSIGLVRP